MSAPVPSGTSCPSPRSSRVGAGRPATSVSGLAQELDETGCGPATIVRTRARVARVRGIVHLDRVAESECQRGALHDRPARRRSDHLVPTTGRAGHARAIAVELVSHEPDRARRHVVLGVVAVHTAARSSVSSCVHGPISGPVAIAFPTRSLTSYQDRMPLPNRMPRLRHDHATRWRRRLHDSCGPSHRIQRVARFAPRQPNTGSADEDRPKTAARRARTTTLSSRRGVTDAELETLRALHLRRSRLSVRHLCLVYSPRYSHRLAPAPTALLMNTRETTKS